MRPIPISFLNSGSETLFASGSIRDTLSAGPMSAGSFLSATGLTYTRTASAAGMVWVQTGPSTMAAADGADVVLIGNAGYGIGAVSEDTTTNILPAGNPRDLTTATGAGGGGDTYTHPYLSAADPAGTFLSTHATCPSGSYGKYESVLRSTGKTSCGSFFARSPSGITDIQGGVYTLPVPGALGGQAFSHAVSPTWLRQSLKVLADGAQQQYYIPIDGGDRHTIGGAVAGARDMLIDFRQIDAYGFPSEFKNASGGVKNKDNFSLATQTIYDTDGRVSAYLMFAAKHSTASSELPDPAVQTVSYLWYKDSTHWARINLTTMKLQVQSGGSVLTSTNTISWSRGSTVEIFTADGGSASVAKWRENGGATQDFAPAYTATAFSFAAGVKVFNGSANDQLWGWIQELSFYKSGRAPAWV